MCFPQPISYNEVQPLSPLGQASPVSPVHTSIIKPLKPEPGTPKTPAVHNEQIQHHLKVKASTAGSVKKATRVLALGMFSAEERMSCTITGGNGKEKFDQNRVSLISGWYLIQSR